MKPQSLSNPPIQEALISFNISFDKEEQPKLKVFTERFKKDFPKTEEKYKFSGKIKIKGKEGADVEKEIWPIGFISSSKNNDRKLQVSVDDFTFNVVGGYTTWNDMVSKFQEYWKQFIKEFKEVKITRIGLRYINSIDVPAESKIADYFKYSFVIPKGLPTKVERYFVQTTLKIDDGLKVNVGINTAEIGKSQVKMLFDIDVYEVETYESNDDKVWERLGSMRNVKNDVFFYSVTDECLKSYI